MQTNTERRTGVTDASRHVQDDLRALREDLDTLAQKVTELMSSTGNQTLEDSKIAFGAFAPPWTARCQE